MLFYSKDLKLAAACSFTCSLISIHGSEEAFHRCSAK